MNTHINTQLSSNLSLDTNHSIYGFAQSSSQASFQNLTSSFSQDSVFEDLVSEELDDLVSEELSDDLSQEFQNPLQESQLQESQEESKKSLISFPNTFPNFQSSTYVKLPNYLKIHLSENNKIIAFILYLYTRRGLDNCAYFTIKSILEDNMIPFNSKNQSLISSTKSTLNQILILNPAIDSSRSDSLLSQVSTSTPSYLFQIPFTSSIFFNNIKSEYTKFHTIDYFKLLDYCKMNKVDCCKMNKENSLNFLNLLNTYYVIKSFIYSTEKFNSVNIPMTTMMEFLHLSRRTVKSCIDTLESLELIYVLDGFYALKPFPK